MKRCIALLLALLLALTAGTVSAFAADADRDPIVYVTGFGSAHLVKNGVQVYPAPGAEVAKTVASLVPAYTAYRLNNNTHAFAQKIVAAVTALYEPLLCDDAGVPADPAVVLDKTNDVTNDQPYGKRNYFYYDWRVDVTQSAAALHDYINAILAATGKQRVALICSSMGACVGAAYLDRYGTKNVSSIVFSSAAVNGVPLVSKLMAGTLPLTERVVVAELQSLDLLNGANLSAAAKRALDAAGGVDAVLRDVAHVAHEEKATLYDGLVVPFLSRMPGVWSLVEQDQVSAAKLAAGVRPGSALDQKLSAFFGGVRLRLVDLLGTAQQGGVRLAILANYTEPAALAEDGLLADGLIPVTLTSFGAVSTNEGDLPAFPDEMDDDREALCSPDGMIDAVGCAFPAQTWFVKGAAHTVTDARFFLRVVYAKQALTVTADDRYPRFLAMGDDGHYVPLAPTLDDLPPAVLAALPTVVSKLRALLRYLAAAFRWVTV